MYLQPAIQVSRPEVLAAFAYRHPFSTLITCAGGQIEVSHVPALCEAKPLRLRAHVARNNPQAAAIAAGAAVTMIFRGPHRYLSPKNGPNAPLLPTWNYVAVHARGRARAFSDDDARRLLEDMVTRFERGKEGGWTLASAGGLVEQLFPLILAFEVCDLSLESRLKVTRDRQLEDRYVAVAALQGSNDPVEREVCALLEQQLHYEST